MINVRAALLGGVCTISAVCGMAVLVASCSSGATSAFSVSTGQSCRSLVGKTVTKKDPDCLTDDGQGSVGLGYGCYPKFGGPQRGNWWRMAVDDKTVVVGRVGGVWRFADANAGITKVADSVGC